MSLAGLPHACGRDRSLAAGASRTTGAWARILVLLDYYLPGFKAGGPVRSIANLVDALGDELDFRIITRDRDAGDAERYPGIRPGAWQPCGKASVCYLAPEQMTSRTLAHLIRATPHDVLYLNSFFSPFFTARVLLLRRLGLLPPRPVVLSPKGELSRGALGEKALKKRAYLAVSSALHLYRGVVWQASSPHEANDIRAWSAGRGWAGGSVHVAPDLPTRARTADAGARSAKEAGRLRLAFVSRISPMKNLTGALEILGGTSASIELDIFGPLEDRDYWAECERRLRGLPPSVRAAYRGVLAPQEVGPTLAGYDLLLLPTKGENYGHVIVEALAAGCPVLISDRTPWRGLAAHGAGWDLPLTDLDAFRRVLETCAAMGPEEHRALSRGAIAFAERHAHAAAPVEQHRALFRAALRSVHGGTHSGAAGHAQPTT
jgi:glycosyltransferase involved in cell wall biosynthesis